MSFPKFLLAYGAFMLIAAGVIAAQPQEPKGATPVAIYWNEPTHCEKRYQIAVLVASQGTLLPEGAAAKHKMFWMCGEK